ncbi:hypothetical protein MP228_009864 [Amoeboaphelidium protococcarum]|nr:hypothetical protein MP228_009864 [Amoeboaphelidium protococcarum]
MVKDRSLLSDIQREDLCLRVAECRLLQAVGRGNLDGCVGGQALKFAYVLCFPSFNVNLLSIQQITAKEFYVMFTDQDCQIEKNGLQIVALDEGNVYVLRFDQNLLSRPSRRGSSDQQPHLALLWCCRLGHVGRCKVAIMCGLHHQQLGQNLSAQYSASSCSRSKSNLRSDWAIGHVQQSHCCIPLMQTKTGVPSDRGLLQFQRSNMLAAIHHQEMYLVRRIVHIYRRTKDTIIFDGANYHEWLYCLKLNLRVQGLDSVFMPAAGKCLEQYINQNALLAAYLQQWRVN